MYDEELAFTGLGSFAIGGFIFEAVWLVALASVLAVTGLLIMRFALRGGEV